MSYDILLKKLNLFGWDMRRWGRLILRGIQATGESNKRQGKVHVDFFFFQDLKDPIKELPKYEFLASKGLKQQLEIVLEV